MINSITCQIKKLDRELDGYKERLRSLKVSQAKKNPGICLQSKGKNLRPSKSAMNRKKIPVGRDVDVTCKKHQKVQKKVSDKGKRDKDLLETPCNKKSEKVKQRSRSASCGRECDCGCLNENYFHNNLVPHKQGQHVFRSSWANILKEHNKHNSKKIISDETSKGYLEKNNYILNPTSIYLKNRGVQCSESSFIPQRTISGVTGFTPYNPTRTLQFLMSEIRENLKHKREDKVLSIINDMEDTVFRLRSNPESMASFDQKKFSNQPFREPLLNNNMYSNQEVNKVFEEGFARLETTCKTLEITCARLKEENRQLRLDLQKKDTNISVLEKKDRDNLGKIDLLSKQMLVTSQKGEQYSQSIHELTKLLSKVQQENKCIEPLKEMNALLESNMNKFVKEKENYIFENQILKLENEKFKVLLEIKEKQLFNYKDVFFDLEDNVRTEVKVVKSRCVSEDSDPDSSVPLCSSPNTSGSMMAPVYGSWRGVSRVSSNAESNHPPSQYRSDFHVKPSGNLTERLAEPTKLPQSSSKDSTSPRSDLIHVQPNLDAPLTKNPLEGIDGIRGQIKMLFADQYTQNKMPHNLNPQWTNLNTIHSSVTSYNTTT